jgi:hypothetical protein
MIIMTYKVDPRAEIGARILIKESSIKVIDACQDSGKAQLILILHYNSLFYPPLNNFTCT